MPIPFLASLAAPIPHVAPVLRPPAPARNDTPGEAKKTFGADVYRPSATAIVASAACRNPDAFGRIIEDARREAAAGHHPIVIFDLDDTLFRTATRSLAVLRDWVTTPEGLPYAAACAKLTPADVPYSIEKAIAKMGVPPEAQPQAKKFWLDRFFTSAYLRHDEPYDGAVAFVKAVRQAGARVVYMTGRQEAKMREGTEAQLRNNGFPWDTEGRGVTLIMKQKSGSDVAYKEEICKKLVTEGSVVGSLDNEPVNVGMFHRVLPDATTLFIDKPHSPDAPPVDAGIDQANDFPKP